MLWLVTTITFLATVAVLTALFYALVPGEIGVAERLSRLIQPPRQQKVRDTSFSDKQKERVRDTLAAVGGFVTSGTAAVSSKDQLPMVRAGYRTASAMSAMRGLKILMPIILVALAFATGIYRVQVVIVPLLCAMAGYLLPDLWLMWRVQARQHRLQLALPDALDMMVICVEAGLGLDQALLRVAQELRITHPELSEELQLVNMEHCSITASSFRRLADQAASTRRRNERQDVSENGAGAGAVYFSGFDGSDSGARRDHVAEAVPADAQPVIAVE
jgi:tight adherence protein C